MAEQLQNGDFSDNLDHWTLGIEGSENFTADNGKAKAISASGNDNEIWHRMRQGWNRYDEVVSSDVDIDYEWDVPSGSVADGEVRFLAELKKPDSSLIQLAKVTKGAGSGNGSLLSGEDIKANLDQNGDYYLRLSARCKSAKNTNNTDCDSPYGDWTNYGMTLYESNAKCRKVSPLTDLNEHTAYIQKSFYSEANPPSASISVKAKGKATTGILTDGRVSIEVYLLRPGLSTITLYNGSLTDDIWTQILNSYDISSYITATGTYTIKLLATVASGEDAGSNVYASEGHFWITDVNVAYYSYEQAAGWFDNASVEMAVKKKKVFIEALGASPVPVKQSKIGKSTSLELGESHSERIKKVISFSGGLEIGETFINKAKLIFLEVLRLATDIIYGAINPVSKSDTIGLDEDVQCITKKPLSKSGLISISELLFLAKITGNVRIDLSQSSINYSDATMPVTHWIKTKFWR